MMRIAGQHSRLRDGRLSCSVCNASPSRAGTLGASCSCDSSAGLREKGAEGKEGSISEGLAGFRSSSRRQYSSRETSSSSNANVSFSNPFMSASISIFSSLSSSSKRLLKPPSEAVVKEEADGVENIPSSSSDINPSSDESTASSKSF